MRLQHSLQAQPRLVTQQLTSQQLLSLRKLRAKLRLAARLRVLQHLLTLKMRKVGLLMHPTIRGLALPAGSSGEWHP